MMRRYFDNYILQELANHEQMLFLTGPRQVGKTTLSRGLAENFKDSVYLNWDFISDRQKILSGQHFIEEIFPLSLPRSSKPLVIFDELHKFSNWRNYLKGFYDKYKNFYHIIVTGSAKMDLYRKESDSLMGRYFLHRVHPITYREIAELGEIQRFATEWGDPIRLPENALDTLFQYGGFPQPFLAKNKTLNMKWKNLRREQLLNEEIRSLTQIQELSQMEVLYEILESQVGQILNRASLAKKIQVTAQTVARWIDTLKNFYHCFTLSPWHRNISRSLIKEPKLYLWDWSSVTDKGARFENMVASHLLKWVHYLTDTGAGSYSLHFIRNKDQKEVDFLVTKNQEPWILVEAKFSGKERISPALGYFQKETQAPYAFQVAYEMDYMKMSCFNYNTPMIVPAKTFFSQLV